MIRTELEGQADIFAGVADVEDRSIQAAFETFHVKHPDVYRRLRSLARQAKGAGRTKWAIGNLWEILRWERHIIGLPDPAEDWKLNDHYRSRYSRLLMEEESDLAGFFDIRELTSR